MKMGKKEVKKRADKKRVDVRNVKKYEYILKRRHF